MVSTDKKEWWDSGMVRRECRHGVLTVDCGRGRVVALVGGRAVEVAARADVEVVFDLAGYVTAPSKPVVTGPKEWVEGLPAARVVPVVRVEWADQAAPRLPAEWWGALWARIVARGVSVVGVGCVGGHGRTGTFLACVVCAAAQGGQWASGDALIGWVRREYCPDAIESTAQEDYVRGVWAYYSARVKGGRKGK